MELSNWPLNVQFSLACPKPSVDDCLVFVKQACMIPCSLICGVPILFFFSVHLPTKKHVLKAANLTHEKLTCLQLLVNSIFRGFSLADHSMVYNIKKR